MTLKDLRWPLAVLVVVGLVVLQITCNAREGAVETVSQVEENRQTDEETRTTLLTACQQATNALVRGVRHEFVDLKRPLIAVLRQLGYTFPGDSKPRRILFGAVHLFQDRIDTIDKRLPDVPCDSLYPPP